jgi:dTDP-4-amino-4,6-dideoxygalactose transaminase
MGASRVIGGVFGLEPLPSAPVRAVPPPFARAPALWTVNGRSAIRVLGAAVRPRQVWVPSYLCDAVLLGLTDPKSVRFYEVNARLAVAGRAWLDDVRADDLVVLIDYFGFPAPADVAAAARARGACVLEDACQALLTEGLGPVADFLVFSPRKFVGVPDGGLLVQTGARPLPDVELAPPPGAWWRGALAAVESRRDFDRGGTGRDWFAAFQAAESDAPSGTYAASELTRSILTTAVDWSAVAARRRANWEVLAAALGDVAVFPVLPAGVAPLGFPVRVSRRDQVREALFAHEIYPPVHWPLAGVVPERFLESHRLAAQIMTLPCDQRCGPTDMERMANLVRGLLG